MGIQEALVLLDFLAEMTDKVVSKIEEAKKEGLITIEEQQQLRDREQEIRKKVGML